MYSFLVHSHSYLRFLVLLLLFIVVGRSLAGWLGKRPFTGQDNRFSLWLLIVTHVQLVLGLILYFVSDQVKFGPDTMSHPTFRYWTVEHSSMMLIAVILITVARITHKKMASDSGKHLRLFVLNAIALLIIIAAIVASGRGLFIPARLE